MEPTLAVFIFTALRFLGVLGALIAVHEFGHFIVAKKSGVLVERFFHWIWAANLAQEMGRHGIPPFDNPIGWLRQNVRRGPGCRNQGE